MCDLEGKVVLVSGAGQGIGARTVEVLAEAGAVVFVTGRTDAPCKAVVERVRAAGHQAHFRHLDVTREEETLRNVLALHPIGRLGEVDDVAKAIRYLASDDSSFVTGAELAIDGGLTAV